MIRTVHTRQLGFLYRLLVWEGITESEKNLVTDVIQDKKYGNATKLYLNKLRERYIKETGG